MRPQKSLASLGGELSVIDLPRTAGCRAGLCRQPTIPRALGLLDSRRAKNRAITAIPFREIDQPSKGIHMTGDVSGVSGLPVLIAMLIVAAVFVSILVWSTRPRRDDGSYRSTPNRQSGASGVGTST